MRIRWGPLEAVLLLHSHPRHAPALGRHGVAGAARQSLIVTSAVVTTADGPMPSTVRMVFQVPGNGKR